MNSTKFDFETIILRFRDLSTHDGETVSLHSKIAVEQGHVWWGWWNKGGEQVPLDEFVELRRKARASGGLKIHLLDSGHGKTYTATCTDISWDSGRELIESPEQEKTPEYYRGKKVFVWFRLGPIEPGAFDTQSLTYVRVDRFFTSQSSKYGVFYGKRVFSAQELTEQNRTIWFVRAARPSDKNHEVSLLDAATLTPEHFPRRFIQTGSNNLLWLSDLHFTSGSESHHGFSLDPKAPANKTLGQALEAAMAHHQIKDVGGVLVTGDITWRAESEEFKQSVAFFNWMESASSLTRFQFAICPGNHDLAYSNRDEPKDAPVRFTYAEAKEQYEVFYNGLFGLSPNEHLSCGRRFLLGENHPVEVVCLNSSVLQQRPGLFRGHGFIGADQLNDAAKAFGWSTEDRTAGSPFRIVMLHHHLVPVNYRDQPDPSYSYSVTLDAEALMRWVVQYRVDVVLHGHMHQPACVRLLKPLELKGEVKDWHEFYVVGMGSTGVARDHQGNIGKNTFGVLSFDARGVLISVYSVHPTDPSEKIWSVHIPFMHR